jgi:hypothetical protein
VAASSQVATIAVVLVGSRERSGEHAHYRPAARVKRLLDSPRPENIHHNLFKGCVTALLGGNPESSHPCRNCLLDLDERVMRACRTAADAQE